MFELSMYYYIVGIAVILLLATLTSLQIRRKKRGRQADRALYISALQALLEGDQVEAFYMLKEVVAQDSENIDAYLRLGRILADRGKVKQAIQIHADLLLRSHLSPAQKQAINHHLIDDYVLDKQTGKAIAMLAAEFERDTADHESGERLLDLLAQEGKWEEAEVIAEKLYKSDREAYKSRVADVKIRLGEYWEEHGKGRKARTLYKTAYHLDPSKVETWIKLGDSYTTEERFEEAVKSWMSFVEIVPAQAHRVFDRLKRSLFDLGQFNAIAGIFERILEKDPNNQYAAMALADLYEKKGNHSQAEEYYRQVIDFSPQFAPAKLGLARLYREQGRMDEAFDILERLFNQHEAVKQGT
jgi:lipopolysaccharide biosynthesis regulator YciM